MTYLQLGRCLHAQGQPDKAIAWHRKGLQGFKRLSESDKSAKVILGIAYADLGNYLVATGQFADAEEIYETSRKIAKEVDDQRTVGVALGQMGSLAIDRGNLTEAARRYTEALETFRTLGEPQSEAAIWHQLGMVAEKAKNWEEADCCYQESLKLKESFNDLPGVASTCNQLARVAEGAGRHDDAERWFLRALDGFEKTGQENYAEVAANNLAALSLSQGRLAEAEQYAKRALAIVETLDLSAEPWKIYGILGNIAQKKGNAQEAAQWRRKEQDSYFAYPGAAFELEKLLPLMQTIVVAMQGAKSKVEKVLPQLESRGRKNVAVAIRRMLAGERDFERLRTELDYREAYIIRRILAILSSKPASASAVRSQTKQRHTRRK